MKKRTTIYIEEDLQRQMKQVALAHDVTVSKLINDVMGDFCNIKDVYPLEYPIGGFKDESFY